MSIGWEQFTLASLQYNDAFPAKKNVLKTFEADHWYVSWDYLIPQQKKEM